MRQQHRWDTRRAIQTLVENFRRDGFDLSRPRRISFDVTVATRQEADAVAAALRGAGYIVRGVDEDEDHHRCELYVEEAEESVVTADGLLDAKRRLETAVHPFRAKVGAVGISALEDER